MFWRLAAWVGHSTFVNVSGSVRRKLFRHLTGHAPSFFSTRSAGALTSRITSTANALYTAENMVTFNAMPPLIATFVAILYLATVSIPMALSLTAVVAFVVFVMFRWAAGGTPLHHAYASNAANVDGDMIDVVSNMSLVKAFGRLRSEHLRLAGVINKEMRARKRSLYFLERLRIFHAATTALLTTAIHCLGDFTLAGWTCDGRRRRAGLHTRSYRSFLRRATWPLPWSMSLNIGRVFPKRSARSWCRMNSLNIPERAGLPPRAAPSNSAT